MNRLTDNKIVIVKRKTRLEELVARFNTVAQAKFYIERMGADFSDYQKEDRTYTGAISEAVEALQWLGRVQVVDRQYLPNFIFGKEDVVVAIGQDGIVANTLKYLDSQCLIGVNPDPARWDGILLPFTILDLRQIVPEVFTKKRPIREVTMARVLLNDGQTMCAVNDLFIGQRTHVSSRYYLRLGDRQEQQSSSGIIVSTGLGSTGWLKSVLHGSTSIAHRLSGERMKVGSEMRMEWDSDFLYFSVREPFVSKTSEADLVFGKITDDSPLIVVSQMPDNGVIFSDGIESDYLQFNSGMKATVSVSDKKGRLVV